MSFDKEVSWHYQMSRQQDNNSRYFHCMNDNEKGEIFHNDCMIMVKMLCNCGPHEQLGGYSYDTLCQTTIPTKTKCCRIKFFSLFPMYEVFQSISNV